MHYSWKSTYEIMFNKIVHSILCKSSGKFYDIIIYHKAPSWWFSMIFLSIEFLIKCVDKLNTFFFKLYIIKVIFVLYIRGCYSLRVCNWSALSGNLFLIPETFYYQNIIMTRILWPILLRSVNPFKYNFESQLSRLNGVFSGWMLVIHAC
jgi:hypothetical protein